MFRSHLHKSKNIIYNLENSNITISQKPQIKRQLLSLILFQNLFSFAATNIKILSTPLDIQILSSTSIQNLASFQKYQCLYRKLV